MDGVLLESEHPKKRRRRYYTEQPLSAHLVLDDNLRGNVGVVPEGLWLELEAWQDAKSGTAAVELKKIKTDRVRQRNEPAACS